MSLEKIRDCLGAVGDLYEAEERLFARVSTDSRLAREGDLFVCLEGERMDGHQFAAQAVNRGAAAVLAQTPLPELTGVPVLLVTDTLAALGRLAACWRAETRARVVAVTGTAGKTTVKEMLAAILAEEMQVEKNYKNFNNLLGVPLTILRCGGEEDAWVLELGINQPGEMEELAAITRPDLAVVVNVGPGHLAGLGSIAGVAEAKSRLLTCLAPEGTALVSADYPELSQAVSGLGVEAQTFSTRDESARFFCRYNGLDSEFRGLFSLTVDGEQVELAAHGSGPHLAEDMAAAAGAATLLGCSLNSVRNGLCREVSLDQRFQAAVHGGYRFIDDSYNANPLSMRRVIKSAREMAGDGPLHLVLGDMLELGPEERRQHVELGIEAAKAAPSRVFYRGLHASHFLSGLTSGGYKGRFSAVEGVEQFEDAWSADAPEPGVVLFKASRGMRLEEFVAAAAKLADAAGMAGTGAGGAR